MTKAVEFFEDQIRSIRFGCITTGLIDTVRVECYEQKMPIKQIAWTTSEKNRISVAPYDPQLLGAIDRALKKEGFNSYVFSKTQVVVNLPPMSGEDRIKVASQVSKLGEEAKISIRNIRKKFRQALLKEEIQESDKALQALTDSKITEIDMLVEFKIESISKD
jgi:ribosome recycling factor